MDQHDISTFEVPDNKVIITINIRHNELYHMVEESSGFCFFSKDERGIKEENVEENIKKLYSIANLIKPTKSTSCAARTGNPKEEKLKCYGDVLCVLNHERIASEVYIFNGDVKNIACKLQNKLLGEKCMVVIQERIDLGKLRKQLDIMVSNQRRNNFPRLIGNYFEARLMRPMLKTDIQEIYYNTENSKISGIVRQFIKTDIG